MPTFQTRGRVAAPNIPVARCAGALLLALTLAACGPKDDPVALGEPTVDKELSIVLKQTEQVAEEVRAQTSERPGRVAYEAELDARAERRAAIMRDARVARAEAAREAEQSGPATADAASPAPTDKPADLAPPVDDGFITSAIEALLDSDAELAQLDIDVATLDGKVILSGTAPSEALRARAAELAVSIDGVVGILNQVIVKPA